MGVILSRFRKKKTTLEILEGLEEKIKSFEEDRLSTEQQHRSIVGHLVLYSVGLYVVAALLFYFFFFPASLYDQLLYITPLLLFPLIVVLVKRLVSWWYCRKLSRHQSKLADMRSQKKLLLEEVMDKETYKVARQILERFAPDQLRKTAVGITSPSLTAASPLTQPRSLGSTSFPAGAVANIDGMRRRAVPPSLVAASASPPGLQTSANSSPRTSDTPRIVPVMPPGSAPSRLQALALPPGPPMPLPLPRPVVPLKRTVVDRFVEYLVGDGPSNRYALICGHCGAHNGMALKEEFEYLSYRCCYCYHWNPARKQRPQAPRLESTFPGSGPGAASHASTSTSELESGTSSSCTEDEEEEDAAGAEKTAVKGAGKADFQRPGENGDADSVPSEDETVMNSETVPEQALAAEAVQKPVVTTPADVIGATADVVSHEPILGEKQQTVCDQP